MAGASIQIEVDDRAVQQALQRLVGVSHDLTGVFTDAAGEAVIISEDLFKDYKGNWKVGKGSRSQELILLAEAIKNPDEIWVSMMWHGVKKKAVSSRVYL